MLATDNQTVIQSRASFLKTKNNRDCDSSKLHSEKEKQQSLRHVQIAFRVRRAEIQISVAHTFGTHWNY